MLCRRGIGMKRGFFIFIFRDKSDLNMCNCWWKGSTREREFDDKGQKLQKHSKLRWSICLQSYHMKSLFVKALVLQVDLRNSMTIFVGEMEAMRPWKSYILCSHLTYPTQYLVF